MTQFEFEDDEQPKKERSAAEVMARMGVAGAPPAPAAQQAAAPAPVQAKAPVKPGAPTPAKTAPPPPPLPGAEEENAIPGARKDLWKCPHCGAGNKPDRTTCRSCGKSPQDAVVKPWHGNPLVLGGIAMALIAVIAIAVVVGKADTALRPADAAHLDAKLRHGGSASGEVETASGHRLELRERAAFVGTLAAVQAAPFGLSLALAPKGADPASVDTALWIHLVGEPREIPPPRPGQVVSVAGPSGPLTLEGRIAPADRPGVAIHFSSDGYRVGE